jgi:hypothetical protein
MHVRHRASEFVLEANHQNCKIELLGHLRCPAEERIKNLLAIRKLTTPNIVSSEQSHDTVNNEKSIFICGKILAQSF